jgi:hypothetical protein
MTLDRALSMKAQAPLLYLREEELTDGMELLFFAGRIYKIGGVDEGTTRVCRCRTC